MSSGTISTETETNTKKRKRMKTRKIVHGEGRKMIAKVYHFLKEEFAFTELFKEPNCDITHLRNITMRTAEATGVSERTVQKILKEERDMKKKEAGTTPTQTKNESEEKNNVNENDKSDNVSTSSKLPAGNPQEEKSSTTNSTDGTSQNKADEKEKKRKVTHTEGREMIASIYYFLKGEYEVTDLYREPNADFSHLRNITRRTAEAAGVSERTVQKILKEERDKIKTGGDNAASKSTKKVTKKGTTKKVKKEKENKKGKKRMSKSGDTGTSSKTPKKRAKKEKNVQNTTDASTSFKLPPLETNAFPPPPPLTLHQQPPLSHFQPPPPSFPPPPPIH